MHEQNDFANNIMKNIFWNQISTKISQKFVPKVSIVNNSVSV